MTFNYNNKVYEVAALVEPLDNKGYDIIVIFETVGEELRFVNYFYKDTNDPQRLNQLIKYYIDNAQ